MLMKLTYKFLKQDMQMVANDLRVDPNPVIRYLNDVLILGASHLHQKDNWQKNTILGYGQLALWMAKKDTGYDQAFYWMLDKAFDHPKEFKAMLKPYVVEPEDWTPNLWENSKIKSRKLRKEKKIPINAQCLEETLYMPDRQQERFEAIKKQKKKRR